MIIFTLHIWFNDVQFSHYLFCFYFYMDVIPAAVIPISNLFDKKMNNMLFLILKVV